MRMHAYLSYFIVVVQLQKDEGYQATGVSPCLQINVYPLGCYCPSYREVEEGRPSKKAKKADTPPVDKAHPKKKAKHKTKTEVVSDSRLASYGIKKRK